MGKKIVLTNFILHSVDIKTVSILGVVLWPNMSKTQIQLLLLLLLSLFKEAKNMVPQSPFLSRFPNKSEPENFTASGQDFPLQNL